MKLMVDTNILLDYFTKREGFFDSAFLLMALGKMNAFQLWIAPTQLSDLFYQLTDRGKKQLAKNARLVLKNARMAFSVCSVGQMEFDNCLKSSWDDLEDAFVYEAAKSIHADAIITRNKIDFKNSKIPVFDCEELFNWLKKEKGIDYDFIQL